MPYKSSGRVLLGSASSASSSHEDLFESNTAGSDDVGLIRLRSIPHVPSIYARSGVQSVASDDDRPPLSGRSSQSQFLAAGAQGGMGGDWDSATGGEGAAQEEPGEYVLSPSVGTGMFGATFYQDHHASLVLPFEGRRCHLLLLRQGQFSIRLESHVNALIIAKLEIDGFCTRCNFRLMPNQQHTIRETRLAVGQHAVPLTFDPTTEQRLPIQSPEDIDAHVGTLRILFFEAFERPATLKWDWDPENPVDVLSFEYGNLDSFVPAYPHVRHALRRAQEAAGGSGGDHNTRRRRVAPAVSSRIAEAYDRHVQKSVQQNQELKHSRGQVGAGRGEAVPRPATNPNHSRVVTSASSNHRAVPSSMIPNQQSVSGRVGPSQQVSQTAVVTQHRSMPNPLMSLDVRHHSKSVESESEGGRFVAPLHQPETLTSSPQTERLDPRGYCSHCVPLMNEDRALHNYTVQQLRRDLEASEKRVAALERELAASNKSKRSQSPFDHQSNDVRSASSSSRRSASPLGNAQGSNARNGNAFEHKSSSSSMDHPRDSAASRLRKDRFRGEETYIDPANVKRWGDSPHVVGGAASSSLSGGRTAGYNRGAFDFSGDGILELAKELVASEQQRRGGAAPPAAQSDDAAQSVYRQVPTSVEWNRGTGAATTSNAARRSKSPPNNSGIVRVSGMQVRSL